MMQPTEREWQSRRYLKARLALEGVLVGFVVGLVIVGFRLAVDHLQEWMKFLFPQAQLSTGSWALPGLFLLYLLLGALAGFFVRFEPMISGSGIPQVAGQLSGRLRFRWSKVLLGKICGGLLSLGSGLTLGREGPSIQMGAACGDGVASLLKRPMSERKFLISSGAASGLAAAFSAPVAGIIFALEEVHRNFSPIALLSAMTGALTADFITKTVFGLQPELHFPGMEALPLRDYPLVIAMGILLGFSSILFNRLIIWGKKVYDRLPLPIYVKTMIPFLATFLAILMDPALFGSGQHFIGQLGTGTGAITSSILLYVIKLLLLLLAFCSGLPGGIFFPLLVLGSFVGTAFGSLALLQGWMAPQHFVNIVVLSMAGHLSGIVRAPVTGIMLICEMTGTFNNLLPLALVSLVAYLVADLLHCEPVYESLLDLILEKRGTEKTYDAVPLEDRILIEYPVAHGSLADGRQIRDLDWPGNSLIVAVKRGHKEVMPSGQLVLVGGDYLVVLMHRREHSQVEEGILVLCK